MTGPRCAGCVICERPCGDAYACPNCVKQISDAIGDAKSYLHELSNVATGQTNVYRASRRQRTDPEQDEWDQEERDVEARLRSKDGRTTLPTTPPMVNLDARELLWDAGSTLSTWARDLAERVGMTFTCECEPPAKPCDLIGEDWLTWFAHNAREFAHHPAVDHAHDEITYLHKRMRSAIDRAPSALYAGPCHAEVSVVRSEERSGTVYVTTRLEKCERDLYAWPSQIEKGEPIVCNGRGSTDPDDEGCGTVHSAEDRRQFLLDSVEDALLPLVVWQKALPKLLPVLEWPVRSTWWKWVNAQRLQVRSADMSGAELFRGGDVIDLVRSTQKRAVGNREAAKRRAE